MYFSFLAMGGVELDSGMLIPTAWKKLDACLHVIHLLRRVQATADLQKLQISSHLTKTQTQSDTCALQLLALTVTDAQLGFPFEITVEKFCSSLGAHCATS